MRHGKRFAVRCQISPRNNRTLFDLAKRVACGSMKKSSLSKPTQHVKCWAFNHMIFFKMVNVAFILVTIKQNKSSQYILCI